MSAEGLEAALDTSTPVQLIRAAAALRWKRPDLTVTLAELALDASDDPATWVGAAGWLLHGRNVLGDGRQIACDLLEGLGRWGEAGAELMVGPQGRRLRVELAGPARRTGEQAAARALLAADPGVDALDAELHADVLAELARCAADETPEAADTALETAELAWLAAGCAPGVASVLLVRAARDRRSGRADEAVAAAAAGLARVTASGRRAGGTESDHLAAALTAEWIAALVDAGRLDEARDDAVPAANRLLTATRPSRQLAGLRLAVARVAAATDGADTVLAALEPAARDAADADVPELESACRSMLGELHEAAGRLDAALAAVRAAMAAERCDHDRTARLRTRLAAATATWAGRPTGHAVAGYPAPDTPAHPAFGGVDGSRSNGVTELVGHAAAVGELDVPDRPSAATSDPADRATRARARAGNWSGATGAGRRARRLAAEAAEATAGSGWSGASLPELGTRHPADPPVSTGDGRFATNGRGDLFDDATAALRAGTTDRPPGPEATGPGTTGPATAGTAGGERPSSGPPPAATIAGPAAPATDTGRAVAVGAGPRSGSLIGDALLRELIDNSGPARASTGAPHPAVTGPDDSDALADSRTDRWAGRHGDTGHGDTGHGPSANGGPAPDRRDGPAAGSVHAAGTGVADTVVFELDPRLDSTVAVPPVRPWRDGDAGQSGRDRDTGPGRPQSEAPTSRPLPPPAPGPGPEVPGAAPPPTGGRPLAPTGDRRPSVGADTVRVGTGRDGAEGLAAAGAADLPQPGDAGPRPGDPRRRSTTDTDGLGIGDLLAGALAAYRGI